MTMKNKHAWINGDLTMKKINKILLVLSIIEMLASCSLKDPQECLPGKDQCHEDNLKIGLYQVCLDTGNWSSTFSCGCACDGNQCGENPDFPSCGTDGEIQCLEYQDMNVSLICSHNVWIPQLCDGACSSEKGCNAPVADCQDGASICMYLPDIGHLEAKCNNGLWLTGYCKSGLICQDNHCAEPSSVVTDCT